ncbi:hypothetical protein K466DRAFT_599976 [Polyporus arcularius HHB13444]|uniref:Uncharacterized protein n=1 Tax=Polyporus arcularius HHB13444 TaxID=1314778 RepID=A0A5C3PE12_9APHY|nr:hypothetical protein K466DRAFT_599976 [Polyporus arcularius HHB13444]
MATAPASTFKDYRRKVPSAHAQLSGASKDGSDTLIDVNRDPVRRNKLVSVSFNSS